jgi:2,4-dienoyl-CoA reductase-like NADH-dependent reductase (Old Yellow Enzyme family)
MSILFEPLQVGDVTISNRVIMAPLTRSRTNNAGRVPNDLMAEYYAQRASAGLIISEATSVTPMGVGYADTPGIWSAEQVEGWKKVTKAVHAKGGLIHLQLWHVGRISHSLFLNGELPVAPSAVKPDGHVSLVRPETAFETPRALETSEISEIVEAFRVGAENAKLAGFDGVEIHGANGYLIDQFLQDSTNKREDRYGGSVENRTRFMMEVTDAVLSVWDKGRVGMHLAPRMDAHDMGDSGRLETFTHVVKELAKREIAFICTREHEADDSISALMKKEFGGVFISNEGFTKESAEQNIQQGKADAIAFGALFIANPDLPARFEKGAQLNPPDTSTFYAGGVEGYTDYPNL